TKYFSVTRHHFDTEVPQRDNWHYFGKNASLFSFQGTFLKVGRSEATFLSYHIAHRMCKSFFLPSFPELLSLLATRINITYSTANNQEFFRKTLMSLNYSLFNLKSF
ncbi:hypothetical protein, partial [Brevibacillus borstelensis]|uniref:hypothetical protein n=1 Tax=Brevibacillus borstelensis TaxID=45462 RepID=UPI0030BF461E